MSHLTNEQHISQENLLRYVEDDCSRLEMREIDRHLATCPMCSDAVEGLMLLSEPSMAVAHLNKRIDEKVLEKINKKPANIPLETPLEQPILTVIKRPFWQQRWAAAAAVLLLVSGSIWVFKNTQNAEKQTIATIQSETITDTVSVSAPPQYAAAETAKKEEMSAKLSAPNSINNSELTQSKENKKQVLKDNLDRKTNTFSNDKTPRKEAKPSAEVALADENTSVEKTVSKPTSAPVTYVPQTDRTRDYAGASAQNSVPSSTISASAKAKDAEVAKAEDAENEAKKTNKSLEEVVVVGSSKAKKSMPAAKAPPSVSMTSDDILSSADGYFKQKYYETAATEYTRFLNSETSGDRHERALFQLATCYVKLNKKAEAKIIFEKLSAMNGQYERAAKKALKDL
jgi:tetratricopeptide (TPR) repeat protein